MNSILTLFLLNNVNFTTQRCTLHILNSLCLCNYAPLGNDPEPQGNDPGQNTDRNRHAEIVLARQSYCIWATLLSKYCPKNVKLRIYIIRSIPDMKMTM